MVKLYYGGGSCTIEGGNIKAIQIVYRGAIVINSKLQSNYIIEANNNKIIIAPYGIVQPLKELFNYEGEFKIMSIKAIGGDGKKVPCSAERVMDYSELLDTNAEDLTIKSENLKVTYLHGRKVRKTIILSQELEGDKI